VRPPVHTPLAILVTISSTSEESLVFKGLALQSIAKCPDSTAGRGSLSTVWKSSILGADPSWHRTNSATTQQKSHISARLLHRGSRRYEICAWLMTRRGYPGLWVSYLMSTIPQSAVPRQIAGLVRQICRLGWEHKGFHPNPVP
jgi:hypothetical protein